MRTSRCSRRKNCTTCGWVIPRLTKQFHFAPGENVFALGKKLRAGRFDLALVLPNSPRSAIETWLAGIPHRIGYARPWRNFFLTQTVATRADAVKMRKRSVAEIKKLISQTPAPSSQLPASAHQIHEYLHLVAVLGANPEPIAPRLFITPEEIEFAKSEFNLDDKIYRRPFFGLNRRGGVWPSQAVAGGKFHYGGPRNSPPHRLHSGLSFGGRADNAYWRKRLHNGIDSGVCNLAGHTSLRELMAALETLPPAADQ